jgi:hypothetical protein
VLGGKFSTQSPVKYDDSPFINGQVVIIHIVNAVCDVRISIVNVRRSRSENSLESSIAFRLGKNGFQKKI